MVVVSILDLIAFGLAVAAEQRRNTAKVQQDPEQDYNYFVYDSNISTDYGLGAFFLLLAIFLLWEGFEPYWFKGMCSSLLHLHLLLLLWCLFLHLLISVEV
ncbi:hypothetical protein L6452_08210 [Arctium lappa]|uniref:Uncharacterized protein n=1 Tax=Arctium lappa TaxID=4217 RepID=A0ACB9DH35_ARCLA|nr:hypothetical protein L6452_08210 [Arctium lappa]